jgi:protease IV
MKNFFKTLLASFLGFFLAIIACSLFSFAVFGSLAASLSEETVMVPESAILKINFTKSIAEQQVEIPFDFSSISPAAASSGASIGLLQVIQAIDYAATDPAIKLIYINPTKISAGMTHVEEVREALLRFRNSGKPIISYCENYTQFGYYLSSVSDKIYTHPMGSNELLGISSSLMFFKDILDKLGVDVQLIRHGKYKSAGEMFVNNQISESNREQNQAMIDALWKNISESVCSSRNIDVNIFNTKINNLEITTANELKKAGLVDDTVTRDSLSSIMCELFGVEKEKDLKMVTLEDYAKARIKPNLKVKEKIAIIYANGEIAQGKGEEVSSDKFANIISDVRKDTTIKSVVFRVNSPGGDAVAAEIIRKELLLLKAEKPVIVSYGDYAASGGYWISADGDKIFTNNMTLTGSIGVFSMIPSFGKIVKEKGHINIVQIKSNDHADMFSLMRPMDKVEVGAMQKSVEIVYDSFLNIVSNGRAMTVEEVDKIAQGRVWAGSDALNIKLADTKGGLIDAINYAANISSLEKYRIVEYPKVKTGMEKIMDLMNSSQTSIENISNPDKIVERIYQSLKEENGKVYARIPWIYKFE